MLTWMFFVSVIKDTAGKYRELAAKKCHHVPKPTVELQKACILADCPIRTTPPVHRWNTHHRTHPPQPPQRPDWHLSPWTQVSYFGAGWAGKKYIKKSFEPGTWPTSYEMEISHKTFDWELNITVAKMGNKLEYCVHNLLNLSEGTMHPIKHC